VFENTLLWLSLGGEGGCTVIARLAPVGGGGRIGFTYW
jgi:hypothetical protein